MASDEDGARRLAVASERQVDRSELGDRGLGGYGGCCVSRNKCIASRNKCIASRNKCLTSSNKKLVSYQRREEHIIYDAHLLFTLQQNCSIVSLLVYLAFVTDSAQDLEG